MPQRRRKPTAMSRDELRAYVAASRARQGLPPTIQDPATIERVASILRLVNVEPGTSGDGDDCG